jgi:hypothetical protein
MMEGTEQRQVKHTQSNVRQLERGRIRVRAREKYAIYPDYPWNGYYKSIWEVHHHYQHQPWHGSSRNWFCQSSSKTKEGRRSEKGARRQQTAATAAVSHFCTSSLARSPSIHLFDQSIYHLSLSPHQTYVWRDETPNVSICYSSATDTSAGELFKFDHQTLQMCPDYN